MNRMRWMVVALSVLSLSACAHGKKAASSSTNEPTAKTSSSKTAEKTPEFTKLSCTKGSETRTLEVVTKGKGCELEYTKGGKTSALSKSSHSVKHCADQQTKTRGKLEKAGFKCS